MRVVRDASYYLWLPERVLVIRVFVRNLLEHLLETHVNHWIGLNEGLELQ